MRNIFKGRSARTKSSSESVDSFVMTSTASNSSLKASSKHKISLGHSGPPTAYINGSAVDGKMSDVEDESGGGLDSDFSSSVVRVDIEDFADLTGSNSMNVTTHSLRKCKTHILVPYSRLLKLIGWKPFGQSFVQNNSCGWKALNSCYVLLIILVLVYTYIYDIMACQWKLDVKKDTMMIPATLAPSHPYTHHHNYTTESPNSTETTKPYIKMLHINASAVEFHPPGPPALEPDANISSTCEHIVTTYIIPDLLHFAAYVLGLLYFRVRENEHLYALMEKVFLQTANMQSRTISQNNLIKRLRGLFVLGGFWVCLTIGLQCLFVWTFGVERENLLTHYGPDKETSLYPLWLWGLFAMDIVGVAIANCINLAVVLNYAIQCEMLRYYINTVRTRLRERSTSLKAAMKDVLNVRESISSLNSAIARMTSLAIIRCAEMFVIGLRILILNENDVWKVWLYRSVFLFVWGAILVFPLIQAASMNAACSKFKTVALSIRVFGYQNSSEQELDYYLNYIANTTLRAKLFHIPVKPSYLLGVLILSCFTMLLLFQTSLVGPAGRIF